MIIGATGATGRHVLRELLQNPHFTRVGEFGRRSLPDDKLQGVDTSKLERKVVDFERLDEKEWKEGRWDVVYITCVSSTGGACLSDVVLVVWALPKRLLGAQRISKRSTESELRLRAASAYP